MARRLIVPTLLLLLAAAPLLAQTSTGRHRRPAETEEKPEAAAEASAERDWFVVLGAGLVSSGDLARVRTVNGGDQTWDPPEGQNFSSADFTLTLDESIGLTVGVGRRLGDLVHLRLDFSAARLPVTALARVGESAEVYRWDDLSIAALALSAEMRLSRTPSHLYVLAGGGLTRATGNRSDALDQTVATLRLGGGFRQRMTAGWSLRGELRDTVQSLSFDDFTAPVPPGAPIPAVEVEERGPQHLVELVLLLQGSF